MFAAALLILAVALAGCSQSTPEGEEPAGQASATFGTIRGLVVTEAIVPLEGVVIELDEGAGNTKTDSKGLFSFDEVVAGAHRLRTNVTAYLPALAEVQVQAGEATPIVRMVVTAETASSPFVELVQWDGFIQCAAGVGMTAGNCAPAVFGDDFSDWVRPSQRPDWVQSEMVWKSTQSVSPNLSLQFWCNQGDPCPTESALIAETVGPSPQTLILERGAIEKWQIGDPQPLYLRVDGRGAGEQPVLVASQQFTVYSHVFYHTVPPLGWTFVEDGAPPV